KCCCETAHHSISSHPHLVPSKVPRPIVQARSSLRTKFNDAQFDLRRISRKFFELVAVRRITSVICPPYIIPSLPQKLPQTRTIFLAEPTSSIRYLIRFLKAPLQSRASLALENHHSFHRE